MALYISRCVSHVWSVCFSLYEALLKLDQRCCTMHSFNSFVMNILLSSSYQLQFISLDGCTVHVFLFSFRSHCNYSNSSRKVFYLTWKEYVYSYCAFSSFRCAFDRSLVLVGHRLIQTLEIWGVMLVNGLDCCFLKPCLSKWLNAWMEKSFLISSKC